MTIRPEFARFIDGWQVDNHVKLGMRLNKLSQRVPRDFSDDEMQIIAQMLVEQKRLQTLYRIEKDNFLDR